jgi:hypothetical protein
MLNTVEEVRENKTGHQTGQDKDPCQNAVRPIKFFENLG